MCALRIGLVIDRLDPSKGGAEAYLLGLARFLTERGHSVHFLAQHFGSGVESGRKQTVKLPPLPRAFRDIAFDREAARLSTRLGLAVTLGVRHTPFTQVFQPHGGVYSRAAAAQSRSAGKNQRLHGVGRVFNPKHHALRYLEGRQRRRRGVTYVALSRRVQAAMECAYGLNEAEKPILIYNGVNLERFHPDPAGNDRSRVREAFRIAEEDFLVLFIAHNFRLKGLDPLLNTLAMLEEKRVQLLVVGRGRVQDYLGRVESPGLKDRVTFAGTTHRPECCYRAADVLAHPTWYDPCSSVCLEALASGLPVITTRTNGVSELMQQGGGGVVLEDAGDEAGLGEALMMLVEKVEVRRRMAAEARRLGEAHPEQGAYAAMEEVLLAAVRERG